MRPSILVISSVADTAVSTALVDDDLAIANAIGTREGLELAARGAMDLVVLVARGPDADTRALVRRLRADRHTSELPVLVLDHAAATRSSVLALETGATDWLPATIESAELRATVRLAMRERRRTADALERAGIDPLTGLGNARLLHRRLDEELDVWDRYHRDVSLVLVEIDGYAALEGTRGLTNAESIALSVCEVSRTSARSTDAIFYVGGGQLAAVLRETPGPGAMVYAERVRARVAAGTASERARAVTTVSVGVGSTTAWRMASTSLRARLLSDAEAALTRARIAGGNACVAADQPPSMRAAV